MESLSKFYLFLMNDMNIDINSFNEHEPSAYYRPNMVIGTKNTRKKGLSLYSSSVLQERKLCKQIIPVESNECYKQR